jgi:hypothetical protein
MMTTGRRGSVVTGSRAISTGGDAVMPRVFGPGQSRARL